LAIVNLAVVLEPFFTVVYYSWALSNGDHFIRMWRHL